MSSSIRLRCVEPCARAELSTLWLFWLKVLLAIAACIGTPLASAAACTFNWTATPAGATSYVVTTTNPDLLACDPNLFGLYSDGGGNTNPVVDPRDNSQIQADLSGPVGMDYPVTFTPSPTTTLTSWSFRMYQDYGLANPVTINVTRQLGIPTLSSVASNNGPTGGGNTVTVNGTNFVQGATVFFDGVAATGVVVVSQTAITVNPPSHSAGVVDVRVTTSGGTATGSGYYTYLPPPTITGVSPSQGTTSGGTAVTISGTNLQNVTSLSFGGTSVPSVSFTSQNSTQIVVNAPARPQGMVDIVATSPGGQSPTSAADQFTYVSLPTVSSVTPNQGPSTGGGLITINGTNFVTGATTVSFGATPATGVNVLSPTSLNATIPAGSAGTVDVTVTTAAGTSTTSAADWYTYADQPTMTMASPSSGPIAGGTSVTITGTGFTSGTSVTFGGVSASGVTFNSATSITVTTPAHAAGTVNVVATTAGGSTTQPVTFTYFSSPTVTSIAPQSGPVTGGSTVTITGTNFTGATQVTFGGTNATSVTVNSSTSITATAPSGSGTVDVRVQTPGGTSAIVSPDRFTYVAAPTVTGLSTSSGPVAGGTSVVITGTGFTGATAVTFGGTNAATAFVNNDTTISATSPAGTGIVDVRVTTVGGTSATSASDKFTYVAAPTVASVTPSIGPDVGGGQVMISGTGLDAVTSVKFGGTNAGFSLGTATSMTATVPAGTAGTVDVIVTSLGGSSATGAADRYTYVTKPTAVGVSMTVAFNSGATPVNVDLSNGVTSVAVGTPAANGTATAVGTSLTYKPNAGFSGTDTFSYTMTNLAGPSLPGIVTVTVSPSAFAYSPSAPPAGTVGVPYTTDSLKSASGGTAPYTYAVVGTLPPGLTLDPSGTLHGTPTTQSVYSFQVKVTDNLTAGGPYSIVSNSVTMTIGAPTITFNVSSLPGGTAGVPYSQTIQASGGTGPYTYVLTGTLPTGISWNAATGVISGTPTQVVPTTSLSVTATDSNHFSASLPLTLQIAVPVLDVTPNPLPAATLGQAYSQVIAGSGGNGPYTFTVTGLPNGLTATSGSSGVTIAGTPTAAGPATLAVKITDNTSGVGAPFSANKSVSLTVNTSSMTLAPSTLPTPVAGQAYNQTITAANGVAPYRYVVTTGTLPAGLTLDPVTGIVSGTPTTTGTSTFTITATDSSTGPGTPLSAFRNYNFNITGQAASAPAVQTHTLSNAPVTFRATANAIGGPFTRIAIVTPPSSGTAVVNGEDIVYTPTPTTNGNVTFAYTLTNAVGTSAPISVTVAVQAVPVTAAALELSVAANATADFDITTGATGGPFTAANVLSISPANAGTATIIGKTSAPTGNAYTLRFVPAATFAGVAVVSYTISNANATSAPGTAKVTVAPRKDPTTDPDVTGLIGAQVEAARRFATTQIGNYNQRLEMLHGKGRAPSSNGLNVVLPSADRGNSRDPARCQDVVGISDRDACLRGEVSPTAMNKAKSLDVRDKSDKNAGTSGVATGDGPNLPGEGENGDQRFAYWTAGTVDFGFANTAAQRSGFKFTTGGVTMGADYRFSDQFSLGAGVGYGHDATDIGSSGTRSTGDSYSGALYASYRPIPVLFVDAVAGFGTLSFDSRRWVVDANDFATGKRNGQQFFGALSAGYEYRTDDWLFSPYGRLTASRSTLDQYSETGAGLNALTYFKQNVNTLSGTLGVRAGFAKATRIGTFSPYIRVELQHDFNGQSLAGLAYADIASSGPVYFVPGTPYGSNRVQVGAGTKLRTGTLVFGLDYSVTTGMGGLQQGFRLTFTAPF
ncbi:IPT/TIG domain-containing protein [Pandoraea sputorum]|uniref:IPT/TIG domain-containing protein n=1 Tax=Pandoraea sputorum TaxID=93222 RepID=UPI001E3A5F69|nr:IPT/TIG domain-containing protein [Pandoraea sputorum]MCE4063424.1 IPT/TIG domain-containing protein [Pandoraea sputorum]